MRSGMSGQPRDQGGIEGVLQEDGAIEALGAEARGESAAPGQPLLRMGRESRGRWLFARVEVGDPGARQHGEVGVRKNTDESRGWRAGT